MNAIEVIIVKGPGWEQAIASAEAMRSFSDIVALNTEAGIKALVDDAVAMFRMMYSTKSIMITELNQVISNIYNAVGRALQYAAKLPDLIADFAGYVGDFIEDLERLIRPYVGAAAEKLRNAASALKSGVYDGALAALKKALELLGKGASYLKDLLVVVAIGAVGLAVFAIFK